MHIKQKKTCQFLKIELSEDKAARILFFIFKKNYLERHLSSGDVLKLFNIKLPLLLSFLMFYFFQLGFSLLLPSCTNSTFFYDRLQNKADSFCEIQWECCINNFIGIDISFVANLLPYEIQSNLLNTSTANEKVALWFII